MKIFNCLRQSSSECKKLSKRNCFPQLKSAWHRLPTMYQSDSFDLEFLGANNVYIRYINFPNIYHKHCAKGVHIQSFFWSAFSRICSEYGDLLSKSLYSVQIRENAVLKKFGIWTLFTQWKRREVFSNLSNISFTKIVNP